MSRSIVWLAPALLALALAAPASAHDPSGRAEPRIAAGLRGDDGLTRTLTVRLTDADGGGRLTGATVTAVGEMSMAGTDMRTSSVRLRETRRGVYRGRIVFPHPGSWSIRIEARGEELVTATAALPSEVAETPASEEAGAAEVHPLGTETETSLAADDYATMAVLWLHVLAAMGWIGGVLVMVVALSTRPGVLAEAARTRLAAWYRSRGAWLHWALVPVIVGTGIYNMVFVSPFELAWTPSSLEELSDAPYGLLYEAILIVKLGLFVSMLNTGTVTLLRTISPALPAVPVSNPHPGSVRTLASALGPAGIMYLATVPLIMGAAMALRYVHVLAHGAAGH